MPFVALTTGAKTEQHIRRRFRQWFERSGQSQREAGAAIEWEQQTVSQYFAGHQQIDLVRAITWCEHFGYTVEELLAKSPRTKPENPRLRKLVNAFHGSDERGQEALLNVADAVSRKR